MGSEKERYRYRPEDFSPLPVNLNHLTIYLNFVDGKVEATNLLDMTAKGPMDSVTLDAKDLEILSVGWVPVDGDPHMDGEPLQYDYQREQSKLVIRPPRAVAAGERFMIRTVTLMTPSDNLLEGIYKDVTPPGAPQQYMSQCQQWGFQRIMPIFDDCCAKCSMTTTIEADAAYTHMISNGNISRTLNPGGFPVPKPGDPNRQMITYENPMPMAPYLFIACVGTWDELSDNVALESGKNVRLEYLVPPGRIEHARVPMEILKESVLWIARTQNYDYNMDTYRTICMGKSNFGGMENMGNTTIVTDAALIDEHTLDQTLLYAHAVIVHEFEHNQCGSRTTMETPFDVWLNEAYTVDVERQFMAYMFDAGFVRLSQVDSIRNPIAGPLAIEDGGAAGRIVREGFNDPDELIDGVTYVKAAEVIRMIRLVVGPENFVKGKELYFSRYANGNANTDQFFACFEEVAGRSLDQFKKTWLHTIGYPEVVAKTSYDADRSRFVIEFEQRSPSDQVFHIPVDLALVDKQGSVIPGTDRVFELSEPTGVIAFDNIPQAPAFASLNRDYSFYGSLCHANVSVDALRAQAVTDPNLFNRCEAIRTLTDRERTKLLESAEARIDPSWLEVYSEVLEDKTLSPGLKAYMIRIDEQPLDRRYSAWFRELVSARERLMREVNGAFKDRLLELYQSLDLRSVGTAPRDGIEERMLKHSLLELITLDDTPDSHELILAHYSAATTNTERVAALVALNRSSSAQRLPMLQATREAWKDHLSGFANYLRIVSLGTREDVFDMIDEEKGKAPFDMNQPTFTRALFLSMAGNSRMVWTDKGLQWVRDAVLDLERSNWFVAARLLNIFQQVRKMRPELQATVRVALQGIVDRLTQSEGSPALRGQASSYLA